MSSCTNTRRNLFPLWTSNVWPTNSGMIVHARAQVLMTCLARFSLSFMTFANNFSLTKGPFFELRLILSYSVSCLLLHALDRLRTLLEPAELAAAKNQFLRSLARAA